MSYVGITVLQKVPGGRQYFYSPTNNYCSDFIEFSFFSLRWFVLCFLPRKYPQVRHLSFVTIYTFRLFDFVGFSVGDVFGLSSFLMHFGHPFGSLLIFFCSVLDHSGILWALTWRLGCPGRFSGWPFGIHLVLGDSGAQVDSLDDRLALTWFPCELL